MLGFFILHIFRWNGCLYKRVSVNDFNVIVILIAPSLEGVERVMVKARFDGIANCYTYWRNCDAGQ